jgi:hypothetical protein
VSAVPLTVADAIKEACREAELAYRFNPGSYTFGALNAVYALKAALAKHPELLARRIPARPEAAS